MSARRLGLSLGMATFVGLVIMFSIIPLVATIASDLGTSAAAVGQALTVGALAGASLALIVGPAGDHYGHRRLLITGALIAAVGTLIGALAPNYWVFLLSRIPAGLGGAVMGTMAMATVAARLTDNERRIAISWVVSAASIAPLAGFPLMTEIAARTDWRVSLMALSGLCIAGAVLVYRIVPPDEIWPDAPFVWHRAFEAYMPILRDSTSVLLQMSNVLRATGAFAIFGYLGAYLIEVAGVSLQVTGYVFLAAGVGYLVGTRFGDGSIIPLPLRSFSALATLSCGIALAAPLVLSLGWVSTAALAVAAHLGVASGFIALTILIVEESPAGSSTTLTLRQFGFNIGIASGGALGGVILTIGGFPTLGVVGILLTAAAAIAVYMAPVTAPRPASTPEPG